MKKSVLYVLAVFFVFSFCSPKNDFDDCEICNVIDIFNFSDIFEENEEYFEEWDITIPYQNVSDLITYKCLECLIGNMRGNIFYSDALSNQSAYSLTDFNNYLRKNKEATAFFKRKDCVSVLISTYLIYLKTEEYLKAGSGDQCRTLGIKSCFHFLEFVLSSNMFMSKMNVKEKVQLMVLALESAKHVNSTSSYVSYTVMISIMLSSNYTPFVKDVKPMLMETVSCYYYVGDYGIPGVGIWGATDLITKYAKQFINDNKN